MRKVSMFAVTAFAICVTARGQGRLSVSSSTAPRGDKWETVVIKVTDVSDVPVTGLVIESVCSPRSGAGRVNRVRHWDDPLLVSRKGLTTAIQPGGTSEYQLGGAPAPFDAYQCAGSVAAALFADGVNIGDARMIARVQETRAVVAREIKWYIPVLTEALEKGTGRADLLYTLDEHRDSAKGSAHDGDEQIGVMDVHRSVAFNLLNMRLLGGDPLPDSERLKIILSILTDWQQRLSAQLPAGSQP